MRSRHELEAGLEEAQGQLPGWCRRLTPVWVARLARWVSGVLPMSVASFTEQHYRKLRKQVDREWRLSLESHDQRGLSHDGIDELMRRLELTRRAEKKLDRLYVEPTA